MGLDWTLDWTGLDWTGGQGVSVFSISFGLLLLIFFGYTTNNRGQLLTQQYLAPFVFNLR